MLIITRAIKEQVKNRLFKGKIVIIYGARQVGKTTLVKQLAQEYPNSRYLNCDLLSVKKGLETAEAETLKSYLGENKLIILDEAHKIPNIGSILKILVDTYPETQIVATGSSSFNLANQINEPLTGRVDKFILYPFSIAELNNHYDRFTIEARLDNLLRFGLYPEIFFLSENGAKNRLDEIASDYLYQDVLMLEKIKKSSLLTNLLQLLALQLGNEVSYEELAKNLSINRLTAQRYIDLLEQSFVIFTLRAFSRNLRKEIAKNVKIYFYDLGIRNSLIQNYNSLSLRNDVGALWENFLINERMKISGGHGANRFFWRTYDQKEIDYIEERDGKIYGYEFKWRQEKATPPKEFLATYSPAEFQTINKDNYWNFIKT